jgi:2-isopropylmalate synthase
MKSHPIIIFDTTLRDGEQSPGASLTSSEKLVLARQIASLGVDVIEAGFPAASADDHEAVRRIAAEVGTPTGPTICGLARCHTGDIERAWSAVREAHRPRIHTFLATSDIHLEHKLKMTREEVVNRVTSMVAMASALCGDVEFSTEDACRSEPRFLVEVCAAAIRSGATTLNIPDTVGYTTPDEYGQLIRFLIAETPGSDSAIWSVHCHNDLGLASANTLAGLSAGARQAEVTINGIGERAGNTSLEEIVMALRTRNSHYQMDTRIDAAQIARTSRMVSNYTGIPVQPNKAIVGANAFSHEAGIHQDGVLKHQATYEIMTPETVGYTKSQLVLGKHSGRHAFRVHLESLGHRLNEDELRKAFERFKQVAEKKKAVTDADLEAIVADEFCREKELFVLQGIQVSAGHPGMPTATIMLRDPEGQVHTQCSIGTGPVDAIYRAIDGVIGTPIELAEFRVNAITEGIDALGDVTVRVRSKDDAVRTFGGHGTDTDILVASCKAYLAALNKLLAYQGHYQNNQTQSSVIELATA